MDEAAWDLLEEAGRDHRAQRAPHESVAGGGEKELLFGTGDPDVAETPLFLELFKVVLRVDVGTEILLHADEKDEGELEPFAVVERHELDAGEVGPLVGAGAERELFQELLKRWRFVFGLPLRRFGEQLVEVLFALLHGFGILFEVLQVPGRRNDVGEQVVDGTLPLAQGA